MALMPTASIHDGYGNRATGRRSQLIGPLALLLSMVVTLGLCTAPLPALAEEGDVDITIFQPENDREDVKVVIFIEGKKKRTKIEVTIPAKSSAGKKRDLILKAIQEKKFDAVANGETGIKIKHLIPGTLVTFDLGATGEEKDEIRAQAAPKGSVGFVNTQFAPLDSSGNPSIFTGGIITDVGELSFTLFANDLPALDGATIVAALFADLAPQASSFGFGVVNEGDILNFTFDPLFTTLTSGVVFGTTALSDGVFGALLLDEPTVAEPPIVALLAAGIVFLGAAVRHCHGTRKASIS